MLTRGGRARLWWAALVTLGVVVAVWVAVAVHHGGSRSASNPAPINPGLATRLADPTTAATHAPTTASSLPAASETAAVPAVPSSGGPGPVRIQIPSVGVNAPVVPVGVDSAGEVAIPVDVATVGWYRYSPLPGSKAGSVVLVGHVDSAVQGEGAFFVLHELSAGARIIVYMSATVSIVYRVVSRQQFPKGQVPLAALFATTGAPRLTLITCGGSFNDTIKSYRDNIVITAVPQ